MYTSFCLWLTQKKVYEKITTEQQIVPCSKGRKYVKFIQIAPKLRLEEDDCGGEEKVC